MPRSAAPAAQELRITITLPLAADLFDQAAELAAVKPALAALHDSLPHAKIEHAVVAVRGKRAPKPAAAA
jgi:hypothetical protein